MQGTLRPDRENPEEPEPETFNEPPKCPSYLKGEARKAWDGMAAKLTMLGVLTDIDLTAMEVYCSIYAEWREAKAYLEGPAGYCPNCNPRRRKKSDDPCRGRIHKLIPYGPFFITIKGWQQSPYFRAVDVCRKQLRAYAIEFGLTPSSRSRVKVGPKDKDEDEFEKYMRVNQRN